MIESFPSENYSEFLQKKSVFTWEKIALKVDKILVKYLAALDSDCQSGRESVGRENVELTFMICVILYGQEHLQPRV